MTGREGDTITDPILTPCDGCGQNVLLCQCIWDQDGHACCGTCTHLDPSLEPYQARS